MQKHCRKCNKELDSLVPFQCRHCNYYFCEEHRLPENHNCINMKTSDDYWRGRKKKLHGITEGQSDSQQIPIRHSPEEYRGKINKKYNFLSNLKYKWNNFKNRYKKRPGSKINLPIGFILGLFVPLFIALLIMYLLEPGMTYISQFFGTNNTIQFLLLFLLVPAQVQSIVPWIAWIVAGFIGGYLSKKILIPFISMYVLIWLFLFIFQGNLIQQQFSMIGILGLEQIIIQVLVVNIIFSVLAFGFGGWIGASIGSGYHRSHYAKKSTIIAASVVVVILIITGLFYAGFFKGINLGSNDSYKLGDSVVDGNIQYTFVSAGWEKYSDYNPDEFFYFEVKGTNPLRGNY
ncbi:MAG: hypothetical protein IMZ58_12880 [Thermoplasmata archaeon]|nr:hypothetical protein [Thermoplasmata archaeon]